MVAMPIRLAQVIAQLAAGDGAVPPGRHPHRPGPVQQDQSLRTCRCRAGWAHRFAMAITVGADVLHQTDVEAGTALTNRLCVFRHLAVQHLVGRIIRTGNRVKRASANATATALALIVIDHGLAIHIRNRVAAAFLGTAAASAAQIMVDLRLAVRVLSHLAGAASAAHADVLDCTAETRRLMALKVSQADEHIRIHNGAADFCRFAEFAVENGNFHIVCAAQTIADDNLATRGHGPEAVKVGAVHMLQRVLAAAGIERVAIRQEGQAALLATEIRNHLCVIGAQEGPDCPARQSAS